MRQLTDRELSLAAGNLSQTLAADDALKAQAKKVIWPRWEARGWEPADWDSRWSTICGMLAGFMMAWGNSVHPERLNERNKTMLRRMERFMDAVESFENDGVSSLWPVCDALRELGADVGGSRIVTLMELLESYRQRLEGEEEGEEVTQFQHPWLLSPKGQRRRDATSAAAWWVIRVLQNQRAENGAEFCRLAAACQAVILRAWCTLAGEALPLAGELDEAGREILEGVNAKTIEQLLREERKRLMGCSWPP